MRNNARKIRELRNLTLETVADALFVTKAQVSKMERGIIRLHEEWLDKLSRLYNCSVHDLIDDDEEIRTISYYKSSSEMNFSSAILKGHIDTRQTGFVEEIPSERQYTLRFSVPECLTKRPDQTNNLFALTLCGGGFDKYPEGTQFIFLNLDETTKHLIKAGSIVYCTQKDNKGNYCGDFIRQIEYDPHGIPYAVYKVKYGRNSAATLANTMLIGEVDAYSMMKIVGKTDSYPPPQKPVLRKIDLNNNGIDIKSLLVKVIYDI